MLILEKYEWENQNTNYLKHKKKHLKSDKRPREIVHVIIQFTISKSNYDQIQRYCKFDLLVGEKPLSAFQDYLLFYKAKYLLLRKDNYCTNNQHFVTINFFSSILFFELIV